MAVAYISIGSNIDRERHIAGAIKALFVHFDRVSLSPVYENPAVGFDGDPFLNLAARVETTHDIATVARILADIEIAEGRTRNAPKFSPRTLDLDLLLYDNVELVTPAMTLPRAEIRKYAFVLKPLHDLAPDLILPGSNDSIDAIWRRFPREKANLTVVDARPWMTGN